MRLLVTGGSGFLGANVVRRALARGDEVRVVVRGSSSALTLDGLPVERVVCGLDDPAGLAAACHGVDAVAHVAGLYDPGPGGEAAMAAVHVEGTRNVLAAARAAGVSRAVVCSSSITVGFGPIDQPGDEDTRLDPTIYGYAGPLRAYYETKRAAEALACEAAAAGLGVSIVCPDYVIGPWDLKPTSGRSILQIARAPIPFYPRGGKCFVDAEDAAEAHLLALDRGVPGRRYLLGTHNLSYRAYFEIVSRIVGRAPPRLPLSRRMTDAAHAVAGYLPLPSAVQAGFQLVQAMQQERYRDGGRAVRELGMPVTPIETSIERCYRWFVEYGYIAPRRRDSRGHAR